MTSKAISVSSSRSKKSKKSKKIDLVEAGLFQESKSLRSQKDDNFSEEDEEHSMTIEPVHQKYDEYDEDFTVYEAFEEKETESQELEDDEEIHPYAFYENDGDYEHSIVFLRSGRSTSMQSYQSSMLESIRLMDLRLMELRRIEVDISRGRIQHTFRNKCEA